jgi:hypothetical protein
MFDAVLQSRRACLLWLVLLPAALAQAPAAQEAPTSQEPASLVARAAEMNGLGAPGAHPWHVQATYEMFDGDGKPIGTGTYEEWWAGPKKNKRIYRSTGFTQTVYATSSGLLRRDNPANPRIAELEVRHNLLRPIDEPTLENYAFKIHETLQGETHLHCVELGRKGWVPHTYCFGGDLPVLRATVSLGGAFQTIYNDVFAFDGRFVARDIRMVSGLKPFIHIHVEKIEALDTINDADFRPSPDLDPPPDQSGNRNPAP